MPSLNPLFFRIGPYPEMDIIDAVPAKVNLGSPPLFYLITIVKKSELPNEDLGY